MGSGALGRAWNPCRVEGRGAGAEGYGHALWMAEVIACFVRCCIELLLPCSSIVTKVGRFLFLVVQCGLMVGGPIEECVRLNVSWDWILTLPWSTVPCPEHLVFIDVLDDGKPGRVLAFRSGDNLLYSSALLIAVFYSGLFLDTKQERRSLPPKHRGVPAPHQWIFFYLHDATASCDVFRTWVLCHCFEDSSSSSYSDFYLLCRSDSRRYTKETPRPCPF